MKEFEIMGVKTNEDEVKSFKSFAQSPGAVLIGKAMGNLAEQAKAILMSLGTSADSMRQMQGALNALGNLDIFLDKVADFSLESLNSAGETMNEEDFNG
jgi:hypothetical protein